MDPEELSSFLNTYYEAIFEPVRKNSGTISDVKGDSILSIWATAHPDATTRNCACCAALDIARAVEQFNQPLDGQQLPIRIGMHSGYISLGNVGAIDHFEYRPVGDIEARSADFRLVCATHRDLDTMVADGSFRRDLYFRIIRRIIKFFLL